MPPPTLYDTAQPAVSGLLAFPSQLALAVIRSMQAHAVFEKAEAAAAAATGSAFVAAERRMEQAKAAMESAETAAIDVRDGMAGKIRAFVELAERLGTSEAVHLEFPRTAVNATFPGAIGKLEAAEIKMGRALVQLDLAKEEEQLAEKAEFAAEAKLQSAKPADRPALEKKLAEAVARVKEAAHFLPTAEAARLAAEQEVQRFLEAAEVAIANAASLSGLGP